MIFRYPTRDLRVVNGIRQNLIQRPDPFLLPHARLEIAIRRLLLRWFIIRQPSTSMMSGASP